MSDDETQIRALVRKWMDASIAGEAATVLDLMADDVVFTVVGREPFGKETFAALSQGNPTGMSIEGSNEIVELQVLGDWPFTRNKIALRVRSEGNPPMSRSGYTLTLFRKEPDGQWRLARDANLVTADQPA
ncbi:SgcJ/EcaC family oxidoreductase [Pelagibacterium sp. H642]|uniref:YybH family protein n=1 Tax=Pelagibacterium sp. H642 TaxID=1881069 RepID=UPI002815BDEA|nr:SgcJ/EcaC family oxidoreductase [Pelagibacterium sp. H642]WMT89646.1 SgcJ/EcaC family oxidoreductase [Pelagibacterium sp. H642]